MCRRRPMTAAYFERFEAIRTARRSKPPSGRIEVYSSKIASFNEPDCPGHPAWLAPAEPRTNDAPLHLVANQPTTRLHSQLDFGAHSAAAKHRGREIIEFIPPMRWPAALRTVASSGSTTSAGRVWLRPA